MRAAARFLLECARDSLPEDRPAELPNLIFPYFENEETEIDLLEAQKAIISHCEKYNLPMV